MTNPTPGSERYWEELEEGQQTLFQQIQKDAPEWDVLAVDVAGESEDGGTLFCLVIRRRVNEDENLILSERYYSYNLEEQEGQWLSNGIERRVNGSLATALRVLYAATTNGDVAPDDPMLMDSREDGLAYHPDELTEPISGLLDSDQEDAETEIPSEPEPEPDKSGWVRCRKCGESIPEADAVQFGKGDIGDFWIHEDPSECEADE